MDRVIGQLFDHDRVLRFPSSNNSLIMMERSSNSLLIKEAPFDSPFIRRLPNLMGLPTLGNSQSPSIIMGILNHSLCLLFYLVVSVYQSGTILIWITVWKSCICYLYQLKFVASTVIQINYVYPANCKCLFSLLFHGLMLFMSLRNWIDILLKHVKIDILFELVILNLIPTYFNCQMLHFSEFFKFDDIFYMQH